MIAASSTRAGKHRPVHEIVTPAHTASHDGQTDRWVVAVSKASNSIAPLLCRIVLQHGYVWVTGPGRYASET